MSGDLRGPSVEQKTHVSLGAMCRYFLRLGATGFGGPVALAGYMQRDLVEERGWFSRQDYRDGLAVAQMAPGPLAAQLAMWLAFVRHGVRGATLVSLAFVAPPFVIVVALAYIYAAAGGAVWISSLFYGIAPAAIAIIAVSAYRLLPLTVGRDPLLWLAAIAVGLVTLISGAEIAVAFLVAGLVVVVVRVGLPSVAARRSARVAPALLLAPITAGNTSVLWALFVFFVKAGAFVFGSGLAIVPFLHQGVVVDNGWLSERQFLDAVAVGLITPGPVVITAAFVGFLVAGLPGALVASFGVFLPAYLMVVVPGHWILRHKDSSPVRAFIAGVSAAAAGAIVAAVVILGRQAIVDAPTALIALMALLLLIVFRRWAPSGLVRMSELLVVVAAGIVGVVLRGM